MSNKRTSRNRRYLRMKKQRKIDCGRKRETHLLIMRYRGLLQ